MSIFFQNKKKISLKYNIVFIPGNIGGLIKIVKIIECPSTIGSQKKKKKLNKVHDKRKIQRVMRHLADWRVAKKVLSVLKPPPFMHSIALATSHL